MKRFESIQALRGIAALMVVIDHAAFTASGRLHLSMSWAAGASGVDIFFVISGFVIALSSGIVDDDVTPWSRFLEDRVIRIVPMYWLMTTVKLAGLFVIPWVALHSDTQLWHTIASYLFIPARNAAGDHLPLLPVGWTLNFEMFFYCCVAASIALTKRPLMVLAIGIGCIALAGLFNQPPIRGPGAFVNPIIGEFLAGILLAKMRRRLMQLPFGLAVAAMVTGFIALCLLPLPLPNEDSVFRVVIWGIPAMLIVAGAIALNDHMRLPSFALRLGDASYSIYLVHSMLVPFVVLAVLRAHLAPPAAIVVSLVGSVAVSTAAALLLYRFVESPIMQFRRRLKGAAGATDIKRQGEVGLSEKGHQHGEPMASTAGASGIGSR